MPNLHLANLPPADETRAKLKTFMAEHTLTPATIAPLIGRSKTAIFAFLEDRYSRYYAGKQDERRLQAVIEDFLQKHPANVAATVLSRRMYETENAIQLRELFTRCYTEGMMAAAYAPPGSGKTWIAERKAAESNFESYSSGDQGSRVYLVSSSIEITPRDLLARVCIAANLVPARSKEGCLGVLKVAFRDRKILVVLDEAQLTPIPALEALRELHGDGRVGVLLLGSHRLRLLFQQRAAELEQFNSRIEDSMELPGDSEKSARAILQVELPGLAAAVYQGAIDYARVTDGYSAVKNKTYISMRRLFKQIKELRSLMQASNEEVAA